MVTLQLPNHIRINQATSGGTSGAADCLTSLHSSHFYLQQTNFLYPIPQLRRLFKCQLLCRLVHLFFQFFNFLFQILH